MKKRAANSMKWIGIALIALWSLYAALVWTGHRKLAQAYAALERNDRPMNISAIIPREIRDPENEALVYQSVVLQLKAQPAGDRSLFEALYGSGSQYLKDDPKVDEFRQEFEKLLRRDDAQAALDELTDVFDKKGWRQDRDYYREYNEGFKFDMSHFDTHRKLSAILRAKAQWAASRGDLDNAWETLSQLLRLANAMVDEPFLGSQMHRWRQCVLTLQTLHSVAESRPPDAAITRRLDQMILAFEDPTPFVKAIDGERLFAGEWIYKLPRPFLRDFLGEIHGSPMIYLSTGPLSKILLPRDRAAYLNAMLAYTQVFSEPYSASASRRVDNIGEDIPGRYPLAKRFIPGLSRTWVKSLSFIAHARVTRAGLALLRHADETGALPDTLEELEIETLIDPFTNDALTYRPTESGFMVYSLGENLEDDQSLNAEEESIDDIVWNYAISTPTRSIQDSQGITPAR